MNVMLALLGAALLVNLIVSVSVIRSPFYSGTQKLAQCAIVWLVPLLGPVAIWSFLRAQHGWRAYDTRAYPEPTKKMVAVEINDAVIGNLGGGSHGGSD
jgi:hypothetical protein